MKKVKINDFEILTTLGIGKTAHLFRYIRSSSFGEA